MSVRVYVRAREKECTSFDGVAHSAAGQKRERERI